MKRPVPPPARRPRRSPGPPSASLAALTLLAACAPREAGGAPSFISNTDFRRTPQGDVVGAQDGNIVNARLPDGRFVLVGMLYGDCPFAACANESLGACGFGAGVVRAWASPDLSQSSWALLPGELLPAAQRPVGIYFRPHVVYNAATQRYVLWLRWLNVTGPTLSDDSTLSSRPARPPSTAPTRSRPRMCQCTTTTAPTTTSSLTMTARPTLRTRAAAAART
jgi:hypothetical protein